MRTVELKGRTQPTGAEMRSWIGLRVEDVYGVYIGRLEDVVLDAGEPLWLVLHLGLRLGPGHDRTALVPVDDAAEANGQVWVPFERRTVLNAPVPGPSGMTDGFRRQLEGHYRGAARTRAA